MENQETKLCKHCQTEIPKKAKICPNCRKKQKGGVKWIIIAIVLIFIIAIGSSDSESSEKSSDSNPQKVDTLENTSNTKEETVDNTFSVGDVVETSNLKISFLSSEEYKSENEFITPKDGHVFYRFEFEFENISDSDVVLSSMMDWECYADDYSMEQTWGMDDVLDATISSGKKAKGAIYFEVPTDAKSVVVEYETNFWTENKIIFVGK